MKLTLTDDDGIVIESWTTQDRPEVFRAFAHSLSEIFAIRATLEEAILAAAGTEDDDEEAFHPGYDGDCEHEFAPTPEGIVHCLHCGTLEPDPV